MPSSLGIKRRQSQGRVDLAELGNRLGVPIAWLVVVVVFCVLEPTTFFTAANFKGIFGSQAVLLILTLAILPSLTAGEFDLSFAGVMGVSLVLVGYLNVLHHWPIGLTVAAALAFGLLVGTVHAILVVRYGVSAIVVTLGSGTLLGGLAVGINPAVTAGISPALVTATRSEIFGLPLAFYYALVLTVLVWYVFSHTPLGRYLYFVGVSRDVARLTGLPVREIRAGALITTSFMSALAGVIFAGTLGASDPNISVQYLLPTFAAAFLGSTTITPGRFNAWGSFVSVYFLISGITGLELLGLSGWIEDVFYGGALVVAVTLSRLSARHQERRQARESRVSAEPATDLASDSPTGLDYA